MLIQGKLSLHPTAQDRASYLVIDKELTVISLGVTGSNRIAYQDFHVIGFAGFADMFPIHKNNQFVCIWL